jgi:hypothetical protein
LRRRREGDVGAIRAIPKGKKIDESALNKWNLAARLPRITVSYASAD